MERMNAVGGIALTCLAVLRLTRAITTDAIGDRYIVEPAKRWAEGHDPVEVKGYYFTTDPAPRENFRHFLVSGLECPFCVGLWLGFGALAVNAVASKHPVTRKAWHAVAGGLALNYIVGHVSSRLD